LAGAVTGSATFDGSTNILLDTTVNHTHAYLPLSGGELSGPISIADGGLYIPHPDGGAYTCTSDPVTGAIMVTLPGGSTNTMLRFAIDVFNYITNKSFTVHVSGYTFSGPYWANTSAYIESTTASNDYAIRFGRTTGGAYYVTIGETDSTWSYPQVVVRDFYAGFSGYSTATFASGWSVSFTPAFPGTIDSTLADNLVAASYAKTAGSLSSGTMTGQLTTTYGSPFFITQPGYKGWFVHHPAGDSLIFAPTTAADGTTADWDKQITFGANGTVRAKACMSSYSFSILNTTNIDVPAGELISVNTQTVSLRGDTQYAMLESRGGGYVTQNAWWSGSAWYRFSSNDPSTCIGTGNAGVYIRTSAGGTSTIPNWTEFNFNGAWCPPPVVLLSQADLANHQIQVSGTTGYQMNTAIYWNNAWVPGNRSAYFEATIWTSSSACTAYADLIMGGVTVSTVSTTSTGVTSVRSGALSLNSGNWMFIRIRASNTSTVYITQARMIINP
jgi:hypothetical protein